LPKLKAFTVADLQYITRKTKRDDYFIMGLLFMCTGNAISLYVVVWNLKKTLNWDVSLKEI